MNAMEQANDHTTGAADDAARILVIDNYDSFVYTIVGHLKTLGAEVTVVRNDAFDVQADGALDGYDGVLISPGFWCARRLRREREDVIRLRARARTQADVRRVPGMQALAEVFRLHGEPRADDQRTARRALWSMWTTRSSRAWRTPMRRHTPPFARRWSRSR